MDRRIFATRLLVAFGLLSGIAMSLPLWQTRTTYPQVPLLTSIPALPRPLDTLFLLGFVLVTLLLVWRPQFRFLAIAWIAACAFLVLQDQSRLQPWFIEYVLLFAALILSDKASEARNACCLALAAVYFWSGVHKMNSAFPGAFVPWLLSRTRLFHSAVELRPIGFVVPYIELGIGLCLVSPRLRRVGVMAAVCMHLFLLSVLGPWALDWNRVVWPWNLTMLLLVPFLFWDAPIPGKTILAPGTTLTHRVLFVFLAMLPPLSLFGLWDTYPSFALYSGNPLTGSVIVSPGIVGELDEAARSVAKDTGAGYRIYFADWSNAAMNVPAYPAERVLRRVAQSFCRFKEVDGGFTFILERPSGWLYRRGWRETEDSHTLCE